QEAPAGPLSQHDAHRVLRDRLVGEKIELETLPQHLVFELADTTLRGRTGIRDNDVDPAEMLGHAVESATHRDAVGHVAFDTERGCAELLRGSLRALDIEQRNLGPGAAHCARGGNTDGAGAAGDDRDLAGERLLAALTEFCLF